MWNKDHQIHFDKVLHKLKNKYGDVVVQTPQFRLEYSSYYKKEMGENLVKMFFALDCLVHKDTAVAIKKDSMAIEKEHSLEGRTVNIDPVLVDEYQVVALSRKDRGSRIFICDGIYAEMELFYHHGAFHPFVWTYIDYKQNIPFFENIRKIYLKKIRTA